MALNQFGFHIKYYPNELSVEHYMVTDKCSRDDAMERDERENWRWISSDFCYETRCVCALYERFFGIMRKAPFRKMLVVCVPDIQYETGSNLIGVYAVQVPFDYNEYLKLSVIQKKRVILNTLMTCIRQAVAETGLQMDQFEMAYNKVIEANFVNEWRAHKNVLNRTKDYSADLLMQHSLRSMDFTVVIRNKKKEEVYRELIISARPDEHNYSTCLGKFQWCSDDEIALVNIFGDNQWVVRIPPS